jgi:hypothetical protein
MTRVSSTLRKGCVPADRVTKPKAAARLALWLTIPICAVSAGLTPSKYVIALARTAACLVGLPAAAMRSKSLLMASSQVTAPGLMRVA